LQIKHDTATKTKTLFVDSVCLSFWLFLDYYLLDFFKNNSSYISQKHRKI
jgi:hypothetical protein